MTIDERVQKNDHWVEIPGGDMRRNIYHFLRDIGFIPYERIAARSIRDVYLAADVRGTRPKKVIVKVGYEDSPLGLENMLNYNWMRGFSLPVSIITAIKRSVWRRFPRVVDAMDFMTRFTSGRRHKGFQNMIDFEVFPGSNPYVIVSDYLSGGDLYQYLTKRHGELSPDDKNRRFIIPLVNAMRKFSKKDLVHGDIKLPNIVLDKNDNPYIIDNDTITISGYDRADVLHIMTWIYASPEQLQHLKLDQRSDIFSLGIVSYVLLSNKTPHQYKTIMQALYHSKQDGTEPITPLTDQMEINPRLARIVHKMCNPDLEKRYQSFKEVLRDLRRYNIRTHLRI